MARGDKDTKLLLEIMRRIGEYREQYPKLLLPSDLLDLVPDLHQRPGQNAALIHLQQHAIYLRDEGYLKHGPNLLGAGHMVLELTTTGEKFVQPELAEFGKEPLLPQVVNSIEQQILTYPTEKRDGFLFELRSAIANNRAEIAAKLIVEILPKLLSGGS